MAYLNTTNYSTRFMDGNKCDDVFDIMVDNYSMMDVCNSSIDFCEAIFSNGFIFAMENGMMPILGSEMCTFESKHEQEYHHVIFEDKCYVMYFKEA